MDLWYNSYLKFLSARRDLWQSGRMPEWATWGGGGWVVPSLNCRLKTTWMQYVPGKLLFEAACMHTYCEQRGLSVCLSLTHREGNEKGSCRATCKPVWWLFVVHSDAGYCYERLTCEMLRCSLSTVFSLSLCRSVIYTLNPPVYHVSKVLVPQDSKLWAIEGWTWPAMHYII